MSNNHHNTRINLKNPAFLTVLLLGLVYFLSFIPVNYTGAKSLTMLGILSGDEAFQYPFLMQMMTSGVTLSETLFHLISYGHYIYGYPFYVISFLAALPIRLIYGAAAPEQVQLNLLLLRQFVSVLPIVVAIGIFTWLQTGFRSVWKTAFTFLILLIIPGVVRNNIQWWHPDAITILCIALTFLFLSRDNLKFGRNFWLAAIFCGLSTSIKSIGVFFFLCIGGYLLYGLLIRKISLKKSIIFGLLFILLMLGVVFVTNPLLFYPAQRAKIIQVHIDHQYFFTHGWPNGDIYETGLKAWLPVLEGWYGQAWLLIAISVLLVLSAILGPYRKIQLFLLGWCIPLSWYLIENIAVKPDHYWLPVMIPLFSSLFSLIPDKPESGQQSFYSDYAHVLQKSNLHSPFLQKLSLRLDTISIWWSRFSRRPIVFISLFSLLFAISAAWLSFSIPFDVSAYQSAYQQEANYIKQHP